MALYLVQHGKSLPKEIDPQRGLSEEGIAEVQRIAQVAAGYGCKIAQIAHSGKHRARQTAEIFASHLKPPKGVVEISGLDPLDDTAAVAGKLMAEAHLMLVGHLPFMERLTSYLIVAATEPPVFKFQNGGIVCLDRPPETGRWIIKWALMPNIG